MKSGAINIDDYIGVQPEEQFEFIYTHYPIMKNLLTDYREDLIDEVIEQKAYNRRAANGDLGVRVQISIGISSPTEKQAINHMTIEKAIMDGIKFIISCNRLNDVYSRTKQESDYRVAFQAKDKYEYGDILDHKCQIVAPMLSGRGVAMCGERPLEFHTAMLNADKNEFERSVELKKALVAIKDKYSGEGKAVGLGNLCNIINGEIAKRNEFRDEYCRQHNIPQSYGKKAIAAQQIIRENSEPLMVIFESFGDMCRLEKTEISEGIANTFAVYFELAKGYNMYFAGLFYPEDFGSVETTPYLKAFNKEKLCLLFGGCYDKQSILYSIEMNQNIRN